MLWLITAILANFLFAGVNTIDKYLLGKLIPSAKAYAFYVGVLGILVLVLVPFGFLTIPKISDIFLAILAGIFHILGIFIFFVGLKKFEASRIIPAVGAFLPLFTFGFTYFFTAGKEVLVFSDIIAFVLLLLGTFLVTWQKEKNITLQSLKIAIFASVLFAIYFILIKYVYLSQPFISGLIWTRIGAFLVAICFIFSKGVRKEIFARPKTIQKKTFAVLIPNQAVSSGAFVLQNWAVALAPLAYLGMINALEGTKYIFLLIFATFLSLKFPQILKEEISKKILLQKIIAIFLIGIGLIFLAF
jgi:hypothetical protein